MGELLQLNQDNIANLGVITQQALDTVSARYGTGDPTHLPGTIRTLPYHNRGHSQTVVDGTDAMAEALGLSGSARVLSRGAASAHDIVQLVGLGENERQSAAWLSDEMQRRGLPEAARTIGELVILGTEPIIENGEIAGQMASRQEYPTLEAEAMAASVASADLGEIFAPTGPRVAHELFKEIHGDQVVDEFPLDTLTTFYGKQLRLVEGYRFPDCVGKTAEHIFGGADRRRRAAAYYVATLDGLQSGSIDSWADLVASARAYRFDGERR